MEIIEKKQNDIGIYKLVGRLDSNTSPEFEKMLVEQISGGTTKMVIDFEDLDYISSAGLRVILKTTKDLKRAEGRFILCAMKDYVREVFEISGFDTFLPIVNNTDEALKKIEVPAS